MKDQVRVLGIDDGPFDFGQNLVPVVGALLRLPGYLEAVMRTDVTVDGADSTMAIAKMVRSSRYRDQIKLILIDGIALGGFNVIDIDVLNDEAGLPVATVTRDRPELEGMKAALQAHFSDWEVRWNIIERKAIKIVPTKFKPLHVSSVGIDEADLWQLLASCTVQGALPEPLRVAHLIATAIGRGESKGDA
jgi:endonuclease V-like protein UPF0215 family